VYPNNDFSQNQKLKKIITIMTTRKMSAKIIAPKIDRGALGSCLFNFSADHEEQFAIDGGLEKHSTPLPFLYISIDIDRAHFSDIQKNRTVYSLLKHHRHENKNNGHYHRYGTAYRGDHAELRLRSF